MITNNATIVSVLPPFNRLGVLPPGEHLCEWAEFVVRFRGTADNGRRRKLIVGLAQMLWILTGAGCRVVIVDGSFVTREKWPRDFDLCYEPQGVNLDLLPEVLRDVSRGRAAQRRRFGGEALPTDLPVEANGRSIREAFAWTRDGHAKGVVRLELDPLDDQVAQFLKESLVSNEQLT